MIQAKPKECSNCKKITVLWKSNPKLCKDCSTLLKSQGNISSPKQRSPSLSKVSSGKIKSVSDKRLLALKEYRVVRDKYLKENPICEVEGCNSRDVELHHKKPRAYHLCDVSVFMSVCRTCHLRIEASDNWARSKGYKLNHL